jgi:hypothetical protein
MVSVDRGALSAEYARNVGQILDRDRESTQKAALFHG